MARAGERVVLFAAAEVELRRRWAHVQHGPNTAKDAVWRKKVDLAVADVLEGEARALWDAEPVSSSVDDLARAILEEE